VVEEAVEVEAVSLAFVVIMSVTAITKIVRPVLRIVENVQ
jgi:hypothetical protein